MGEIYLSTKVRNQLNYSMFIFNLPPKLDYLAHIDTRNTQNIENQARRRIGRSFQEEESDRQLPLKQEE
jgi:guanylate kinase